MGRIAYARIMRTGRGPLRLGHWCPDGRVLVFLKVKMGIASTKREHRSNYHAFANPKWENRMARALELESFGRVSRMVCDYSFSMTENSDFSGNLKSHYHASRKRGYRCRTEMSFKSGWTKIGNSPLLFETPTTIGTPGHTTLSRRLRYLLRTGSITRRTAVSTESLGGLLSEGSVV